MTEAATVAQDSVRGHAKAAAVSAADALKAGASKANEAARSGVEKSIGHAKDFGAAVKADGFWKTVASGARKQPLIAGAALVTTAYVAHKAFAGPKQQRVVNERSASQGREL